MNPDRMRRVNALAQLASDQAGTPEGENARRALVGLLDGLGLSADDAEIVIRPAEVAATAATLIAGAGFCAGRFGLARTQSLAGEAEAGEARKVLQSSVLGGSAAVEFRGTPVT